MEIDFFREMQPLLIEAVYQLILRCTLRGDLNEELELAKFDFLIKLEIPNLTRASRGALPRQNAFRHYLIHQIPNLQ